MNIIKDKAVAVKQHVSKHRAKYAAGATFAGCFAAHYYIASAWNKYLDDLGLLEEFYADPE